MSAAVTAITTGEQLQDAAGAGARDIEIRAHLDLRGLQWHIRPPSSMNTIHAQMGLRELLYSRGSLRSLRVRAFSTSVHVVPSRCSIPSRVVDRSSDCSPAMTSTASLVLLLLGPPATLGRHSPWRMKSRSMLSMRSMAPAAAYAEHAEHGSCRGVVICGVRLPPPVRVGGGKPLLCCVILLPLVVAMSAIHICSGPGATACA